MKQTVVTRVKMHLTFQPFFPLYEITSQWDERTMQFQLPTIKGEATPSSLQDHARVFHQMLNAIEAVRYKRQEEYREKSHLRLKRLSPRNLRRAKNPLTFSRSVGYTYHKAAIHRDPAMYLDKHIG